MKNGKTEREGREGFTLMELLVVISVIAILAAMVLAAIPGIWNRINRSQTELLIKELAAGLSAYQQDNGMYPVNSGSERDGAFVLYKHLSGDFDGDGTLDPTSTGTIVYIEGIVWSSANNQKQQRVDKIGDRYAIVDPFGSPIRYLAEPPGKKIKKTNNPTYDLWSLGGAEPGSTAKKAQAKWIRP